MSGIMGYIGNSEASNKILEGLQVIENIDHNNVGMALMSNELHLVQNKESITQLEKENFPGKIGIGYTGKTLSENTNFDSKLSQSGSIVIGYQGNIENSVKIEATLQENGYNTENSSDALLINQYIALTQIRYSLPISETVQKVLSDVKGQYAVYVIDTLDPTRVVLAKKGVSVILGFKDQEIYFSNLEEPISKVTKEILHLNDNDVALLNIDGTFQLYNSSDSSSTSEISDLNSYLESDYELDGFESFMLKEIFEQPVSLRACSRNRLNGSVLELPEVDDYKRIFKMAKRVVIVGTGTSYHAGLAGKEIMEKIAKLPTHVEYSSEFRSNDPLINENDLVIIISRTGEKKETIEALKKANEKGAFTYSIVNNPTSTITYYSDIVSSLNIGSEESVGSTKSFTGTISLLAMIALRIADINETISKEDYLNKLNELALIPEKIGRVLQQNSKIKEISTVFTKLDCALFLGKGVNFPVAREAAYKLNKISLLDTNSYPTEEIKKGSFAHIPQDFPVFIFSNSDRELEMINSTIEAINDDKLSVILIADESQSINSDLYHHVFKLPKTHSEFKPLISSIFIQLLAYYTAKLRDDVIDTPRWYEEGFDKI